MKPDSILFFDVETSIYNKGHPFDPRNKLVSYAYILNGVSGFKYYTDPDFISCLQHAIYSAKCICGFNIKFDLHWCRNVGIDIPPTISVFDCMLAEFIIEGQSLYMRDNSLEKALIKYGLPQKKKDLIADYWANGISTEDIPVAIVEEYNQGDVTPLPGLMQTQLTLLNDKQQKLVYLEGSDLLALADAEYNGVLFDDDKAHTKVVDLSEILGRIEDELRDFLPEDIPEQCGFNWDSGDQMSAFLYGGVIEYEYPIPFAAVYKSGLKKGQAYTGNKWRRQSVVFERRFTPLDKSEVAKTRDDPEATTRFYQTDSPTLAQLKAKTKEHKRILELLNQRAGSIKVVEMINSIRSVMLNQNWENNLIHGQFNQNVVITGRLSSSKPNMQNTPVEIDELLVSRYDS